MGRVNSLELHITSQLHGISLQKSGGAGFPTPPGVLKRESVLEVDVPRELELTGVVCLTSNRTQGGIAGRVR